MGYKSGLKIILADAQPLFREGIKHFLNSLHEGYHILEAGNTNELVPALKDNKPDILVLDHNPLFFDEEAISQILQTLPHCRVILYSGRDKLDNLHTLNFKVRASVSKSKKP